MSAAAASSSAASTSSSNPTFVGAKLYYTPTSCGFASFTTAHLSGLKGLAVEQVTLADHKTASGKDYYTINPKGNVPCVVLADGTVLNENVACLLFLGDQKPDVGLTAPAGSKERIVLINELSYLATEIHKAIGGLFGLKDSNKEHLTYILNKNLGFYEKHIAGKTYVANNKLSVADFYLYVLLSWHGYLKLDLSQWPNIHKYFEHIKTIDAIKNAKAYADSSPATI